MPSIADRRRLAPAHAAGPAVLGLLTALGGLSCRAAPVPLSLGTPAPVDAAAIDARDSAWPTPFGSRFVAPSERVVLGRVLGTTQIPGGPAVARVEVEAWWVGEPDLSRPGATDHTIAVTFPPGALVENPSVLALLFLGPRVRGSILAPLVATAYGDRSTLDGFGEMARETARLAGVSNEETRRRGIRALLVRLLADDRSALRERALADVRSLLATSPPFFEDEDAKALETLATRSADRTRRSDLQDLADRIRRSRAGAFDAGFPPP